MKGRETFYSDHTVLIASCCEDQTDADGIANSVDPDQTAPGAVWSESALFS